MSENRNYCFAQERHCLRATEHGNCGDVLNPCPHVKYAKTPSKPFNAVYMKSHTEKVKAQESEPYKPTSDVVAHPNHYTRGGIECIQAIKAAVTGLDGIEAVDTANAIKYLWRWKWKNGVQDLEKAKQYIDMLIKEQAADEHR